MGVPGLFNWVRRKWPKSVSPVADNTGSGETKESKQDPAQRFDNLYLDLNGVIHPAVARSVKDGELDFEEFMVTFTEQIRATVRRVRPERLLYLAIDGVAPRAQMAQQRKRRFTKAADSKATAALASQVVTKLMERGLVAPPAGIVN